MISGARSLGTALLALPLLASAASWDLDALLGELAQVPSSHSRFVETRQVALLAQPLELRGSLSYERPARLSKHVQAPFEETLSVDGESAVLASKTGGERRVSLREQPALAALVEGIRATLAGDRARLERHYQVELAGTRAAWTLRLVPRGLQVRQLVDTIVLAGAAARVERIEIAEAGGDRSVMRILHDGK